MNSGAQTLAGIGVLKESSRFVPHPSKQLRNELLVLTMWFKGQIVRCLLDSGATHNFASEDWVKRERLRLEEKDPAFTVTMGDGRSLEIKSKCTPLLWLSLDGFEWSGSFQVIPMSEQYDMILGKPWLTDFNPAIDFRTNSLSLLHEGKSYRFQATSGKPKQACLGEKQSLEPELLPEFMNVAQARKELRRGAELIIVELLEGEGDHEAPVPSHDWLGQARIMVQGEKREAVSELLQRHQARFPKELPKRLPPERDIEHEISVEPGNRPPSRPPLRLSQPHLDELKKQLEDLLEHGFIERSSSPYGAPVFFVKKADGSLRLVCDWRALNKVTVKTQACLPSIEDLFDTVQGAKYFSRLDLKSGYHQVRIKEQDIPKTAINTPFGHFQFRVMGFGLTNAPATFMSLMNKVLSPYLRVCVVVFLDDILIFSHTWKDHLQHLDQVLAALGSEQLYCNLRKCEFAAELIKFLGHILTGSTIAPDPEKLEAVRSWPCPKSVKDVRRFLGFANYFRRFIKDYSKVSRCLEQLTGRYQKFLWTEAHQQAFNVLRHALVSAPVLLLPDVGRPFRVISDASDEAIGGVLLQRDEHEHWHPVAFTSRRLRPEERNYHAMERETLAALHALRTWKLYLFKPFELITDNQGVTYLKSKTGLTKREARWIEFLADFDVTIVHRPGRENIADALSRLPAGPGNAAAITLEETTLIKRKLKKGYRVDRKMRQIIETLTRNPDGRSSIQERYIWDGRTGKLYLKDGDNRRLCIPYGQLRRQLLDLGHKCLSSGHPGRDRTYLRISRNYYWPRMGRDVARFVRSCDVCQRMKGDRPKQCPLSPLDIPKQPWQSIGMDFSTGLPVSAQGNDTILTFIDRLTKQAHFVPTRATIDAEGTVDLYLQHVFRLHGLSESIVSDRDPRFTSEFYQRVFDRLGVKLKMSTANHPQSDGQTERAHRVIAQILRTVVNHRQNNWEEMLPWCEFAFNDMVQASTCETPFFLNYGFHPLSAPEAAFSTTVHAGDWQERQQEARSVVKDSIQAAIDDQARMADRSRQDRPIEVGDQVLVHKDYLSTPVSRDQPCVKLRPLWLGPFKVLETPSRSTARLDLPSWCRAHKVMNQAALKKYHKDDTLHGPPSRPPAPIVDADGFQRYIVEKVLSHRRFRGRKQYLVKWRGYQDPTWEPEAFLLDEDGSPIIPLKEYLEQL